MLHVTKNKLVTGVAVSQIEIRQMELDWYCGNYATITGQAAALAGFAFSQLTTPMPEDEAPPLLLEFFYLFLTCVALGLELSAIILSSSLSVWAPSLALKGKNGTTDLHKAVDCLRDYQSHVFMYFIVGWVLFFISNICQVWIYFRRRVAVVVTCPLLGFVVAIIWYSYSITMRLRLRDVDATEGKIDHFMPYEGVGDIDHGLSTAGPAATQDNYCPVHESFKPMLASERSLGNRDIEMRGLGQPNGGAYASNGGYASTQNQRLLMRSQLP